MNQLLPILLTLLLLGRVPAQAVAGKPAWVTPAFRLHHGVGGTDYRAKISAHASGPRGAGLTFSKTAGPAWLAVSPEGVLSGTPAATDAGTNAFTVRASAGGESAEATVTFPVYPAGAERPERLKVMSYNLWHGWSQVDDGHRKGIESVILSDADIIATQESVDHDAGIYQAKRIADELGWYYGPATSGSPGIVSRYPITRQFTAGTARGVQVQVAAAPAREVIVFCCHLDHVHYGPYAARLAGATAASVLAEETRSQRDEQIAAILAGLAPHLAAADRVPVVLAGDFNAPSHLDWTPATAADHGGVGGVAWPVSTAVHGAGLRDSFRDVHPDPVAMPGHSWSPLFLGDPQDRIDFVYYLGKGLRPVEAEHFHTAIETTLGKWGSPAAAARGNTWPSDHGAMLTGFALEPAGGEAK